MELSRKSMVIGVILTLICVAVGIICLAVSPTTFTWIMFAVILALAIFQAVALWYLVKKINLDTNNATKPESEEKNEVKLDAKTETKNEVEKEQN